MRNCLLILLLALSVVANGQGTKKEYKAAVVAFYNLENLFDIYDDPAIRDDEFTPEGKKAWTQERYDHKLSNMAKVIAMIGEDEFGKGHGGPAIVGVSEVENRKVLEDLVNTKELKHLNYGIIHKNSPDHRGIDVALLYRKGMFTVTNSVWEPLVIDGKEGFTTRDQLLVSGKMENGEEIHVIVNHWPSRYGGEKRSRPLRNAAADLTRAIVDSVKQVKPGAKVIVMGDLNDDPVNDSVQKHLNAKGNIRKLKKGQLYNPMEPFFKKGIGTLAYRDNWSLFDQLIVTQSLLKKNSKSGYNFLKARIFSKKFLKQQEGRFKGYAFRTYVGNTYKGGYGDHFPVYLVLVREVK